MNAILKTGWTLALAAAIPAITFAAPAPYGSAVNKAMHPGKPHVARTAPVPRSYVQPRVYVQPRAYLAPQVAATPAPDARRAYSYEPMGQMHIPQQAGLRRSFSFEAAPPAYIAPQSDGFAPRRSFENATSKALGRIP